MHEITHPDGMCGRCGSDASPKRSTRSVCIRCRLFGNVIAGKDGCVVWTAGTNNHGYGKLKASRTFHAAHRLSYELMVGPIPEGYHLDHLCHTRDTACPGGTCIHRRCINPHHLEPVTERVNILRGRSQAAANAVKTHCPRGHEYAEANTRIDKNGKRHCRSCRATYELEARARRAAKRATS